MIRSHLCMFSVSTLRYVLQRELNVKCMKESISLAAEPEDHICPCGLLQKSTRAQRPAGVYAMRVMLHECMGMQCKCKPSIPSCLPLSYAEVQVPVGQQ